MFCYKCGNEIRENAKFCGKCGTPVENTSINTTPETVVVPIQQSETVTEPEVPKKTVARKITRNRIIQNYLDRWKQCKREKYAGFKNKAWIVVNSVLALLLVWNLILCFTCNRNLNGVVYWVEDGKAVATNVWFRFPNPHDSKPFTIETALLGQEILINGDDTVRIGFKNYEIAKVEMYEGMLSRFSTAEALTIRGDTIETIYIREGIGRIMPKIDIVYISCDNPNIYVENKYIFLNDAHNLRFVHLLFPNAKKPDGFASGYRISGDVNECLHSICANGCNVSELSGSFPHLTTLELSSIPKLIDFSAETLNSVHINCSNSDFVSYDVPPQYQDKLDTLTLLSQVPGFELNISHTIDDLYGTWIYKDENGNDLFSLTIQDTGYIRVSDGLGILGIDLLTFSEFDENTLLLKAETENAWGQLLTVEMPYRIFGKELSVSILGYDMVLTR